MFKLLSLFLFVIFVSCKPSTEIENKRYSISLNGGEDVKPKPTPPDVDPGPTTPDVDPGHTTPDVPNIPTHEPEKYPILEYYGSSILDLKTYGQYRLFQKVVMETAPDIIKYNIQKQSFVHHSGSNHTNKVNAKLPNFITRTVSKSKVEDIKKLESKGLKNLDFIVYASQINEGGKNCRLSDPIPMFVIPKSYVNAYEDIKKPVYYESVVSGCVKQDQMLINVFIRCEVRQLINNNTNTADYIVPIAINCSISSPADQKGEFYEQLPLPYNAIFYVNTKTKQVESYYQFSYLLSSKYDSWRNRVKYGEKGNVGGTFKLCKSTVDSKTETFNCQ